MVAIAVNVLFILIAAVFTVSFVALLVALFMTVIKDVVDVCLERVKKKAQKKAKKKDENVWQPDELTQEECDISKTPSWLEEGKGSEVYGRVRWASSTLVGKNLFMVTDGKIVEVKVIKGWYHISSDVRVGAILRGADGKTTDCFDLLHNRDLFDTIKDCELNRPITFIGVRGLRWIIEKYRLGQWYATMCAGLDSFIRWKWDGVRAVPCKYFRIYLRDFDETGLQVKFVNENTKEQHLHYIGNAVNQTAKVWDGTYPTKGECEEANDIEVIRFKE